MAGKLDPEIEAMRVMAEALTPFRLSARHRMLAWLRGWALKGVSIADVERDQNAELADEGTAMNGR